MNDATLSASEANIQAMRCNQQERKLRKPSVIF